MSTPEIMREIKLETQPELTGPQPASDAPRWHLRVEADGRLTAVLTATSPPIIVTGDDLGSLRKQIKAIIMRALL